MKSLKETYQEIKDANDEWRRTFDAMDQAVALLDAEGRIMRCNRAMAEFVKEPFSRIIGHECQELCICVGVSREQCPMVRCRASLKRESAVFNHAEQWFEVSADPILDKAGQLQGAVHIILDITEKKQMELALKAAIALAEDEKARTESIIEAIGDGVTIQDREFRILYQNQALKHMIGDHVGELCYMAYEKGEQLCEGCGVSMVFKDGGTHIVQRSAPTDKGVIHVEITASPLMDSKGNIIAAIEVVHDITERKKAEETLRKSREQLAKSQRIARVGSWERNINTNDVIWSEELFRIFGLDPSRMKADFKTLLNLIHPDDRERQRMAVAEAVQLMHPYDVDYRILKPDGSQAWIHAQAEVVCDEAGRPVLLRGTAQDITERKLIEDEIKRQKVFSDSLIQNSAVATFVLNDEHTVLIWNRACEVLTGVPASKVIGTKAQWSAFYEHERPVLADIVLDQSTEILPSCYPTYSTSALLPDGLHAEGWYKNLNGRDRYIIFDAAPIRSSTGRMIAAIETLQDFTDSKRLEEQIFSAEQDWEHTFNSITDMVTVHDRDFNIILANKAAEKVLGLPLLEKMKEKKCFTYFHGTDHAPAGCPSCGCIQSGVPATFEVFEPYLNMYIEIRAIPRCDINGDFIGLIHVVRDITERKEAEEEHRRLNREKELLREQLLQSQKMEAVGTLAGGIAHDFNNILNVIMGYSGLLENQPGLTRRAREFIAEITSATNRAAHLTGGLLAFSRKQHLELKPADLNDIIQSIAAMLHRVIGEDIRMNIELCKEDLITICDTAQIEQIIVNFATNARDAMPNGGQLSLMTEMVELDEEFCRIRGSIAPGKYAVIHVADTGTGMDQETVQRIFEPFFTTKAVGKGTGLGLSIIYGIVAQHMGFLECESEPGLGTVFSTFLPLAVMNESTAEDLETRRDAALGRGELILVAEDDEAGRRLVTLVLEHQGYRVIEAATGIDMIKKFKEHSAEISLMLVDVIMPDMNGCDALELIRQQFPDTKAVLMSGYTADILALRGIKDMNVPLVKKPVSPHELFRVVRDVLDE